MSFFCFWLSLQNLSYGQTKEFNCEHCHSKLSVLAESTKFHFIPPRTKAGQSSSPTSDVSYVTKASLQAQQKDVCVCACARRCQRSHCQLQGEGSCCAEGEAATREGNLQTLQTKSPMVKVTLSLCHVTPARRVEMMKGNMLLSGSPAVAGFTPVTCATMKTRTTPWNWPPG